ncbi:MAG: acyl-CoA dehydrogenase N-terminal domain-containing protein, partial [Aquabacterium sp.]
MPRYVPPLRDLQFVLHELLEVTPALQALPAHADLDVETINAVL